MNDPKGEYQSDTMHVSNRRMEVVEDDEWYDAYAIDNIYIILKKKWNLSLNCKFFCIIQKNKLIL